jgi:hypothetical protein
VAKDGISKIEQTVNSVKSEVLVLSDSNNDHEIRIETINDSLSRSEEGVSRYVYVVS